MDAIFDWLVSSDHTSVNSALFVESQYSYKKKKK